jgi:hypothetical protein
MYISANKNVKEAVAHIVMGTSVSQEAVARKVMGISVSQEAVARIDIGDITAKRS